jgi:uncharacterized protein (DUF433 family)/DNA-binding transcriptional MerR regulator
MNIKNEIPGIYVAPKAALYLTATLKKDIPSPVQRIPINSRNLINWVRTGLMTPELRNVSGHELILSFEDLISMRVIATLRSLGVTWHNIHLAEKYLRNKTGYKRPFAVKQVWTDTANIFAELDRSVFLAASRQGQIALPELLGEYLQPVGGMTFQKHKEMLIASTWTPHSDITLNPMIQYGEPCISGTRIRTRILSQMIQSGDTPLYVSDSFSLTESQINHGLEWENRLRAVQAA